jgi:hypothetical protein
MAIFVRRQRGAERIDVAMHVSETTTPAPSGSQNFPRLSRLAKSPPPRINLAVADGVKSTFILFVGGCCPFLILGILTISAGYYFNALRGFTGDDQSLVAYGTALIVELVNLALFFVSAKSFWSGKRWHFLTALIVGLALTVVSVTAQVLYLSNNLDLAALRQGASSLQGVPVLGALASDRLIIVTRAFALHLAEFACCYVLARSTISHRKLIQTMQEEQEAELALLEAQQFAEFKKVLHQAQMSQLNRMQELFASPGPFDRQQPSEKVKNEAVSPALSGASAQPHPAPVVADSTPDTSLALPTMLAAVESEESRGNGHLFREFRIE